MIRSIRTLLAFLFVVGFIPIRIFLGKTLQCLLKIIEPPSSVQLEGRQLESNIADVRGEAEWIANRRDLHHANLSHLAPGCGMDRDDTAADLRIHRCLISKSPSLRGRWRQA